MATGMVSAELATRSVRRETCVNVMRYFLRIDSEPGTIARVLAPFAVSGHALRVLQLRPTARGGVFLVAEFENLDELRAALITEKLRQMPCVIRARLAIR